METGTRTVLRLFLACLLMAGSASLCLTGCKPSAEKAAAREALIRAEVEALFNQIQSLQTQGQMPEALALVDKGLKNRAYKAQKPLFLGLKIDLLLAQDLDDQATGLVLQTFRAEPDLARAVFGRIYSFYQQRKDIPKTAAWCQSLLDLGPALPADLRVPVLGWQLAAVFASRNPAGSKAGIDHLLTLLKPEEAVPLLQSTLGGLIDANQSAFAQVLIQHLEGKPAASPLCRYLTLTLNLRCALAAADWDEVPPRFHACVAQLPDANLLSILPALFSTLQKSSQTNLLDAASKQIIFSAPEKTNSVNHAARVWVETGLAKDKKLLPARLEDLLDAKVALLQVCTLFDRYFYDMIADRAILRKLCTVGGRILALTPEEATANPVKLKLLDGAFLLEDFDLAIQMLEKGIPGKDKVWHAMSLPKVKAHRAMAQKKPLEAVQHFREFMQVCLDSDQKEESDPSTGVIYSREWILARNANRIAGILASIPDKAGADQARAEAKAYFKTALEKAANDAEATKLLKAETQGLGL